MIDGIKWFDRQFSFDLPVWMYPNIVARVRGTPARAEDLVRALPREILTRRDGDKWSIQEHVGHLLDLETLGMRRLDEFSAGRESLSSADLENRKTWEANHNARAIAEILTALRSARSEFVQRLESFDDAFIQRTSIHPRLQKPIRVLDLAFFIAEHDDHHLAHISALIRQFREK
ncbi:DinB family protein [candidate division KSB1 bacterium]|nr:DinB family protein [candidate division KSB1 bacterium]